MKLCVEKDVLKIRLSAVEKILSMHGSLAVNLRDIVSVGTDMPKQTWKEVRAPGTFLPGLVKAGTYYSGRGREFWCLFRGRQPLRIELRNNSYRRFILGVDSPSVIDDLNDAGVHL